MYTIYNVLTYTQKNVTVKIKTISKERREKTMFIYNIDVLAELKKSGYTTFRLRQERKLSEATIQKIRNNEIIGIKSLDAVCNMLGKQPNYIIKHIPDKTDPEV